MKQKTDIQNLHTHTVYCDGADAPEELVRTAIEKGHSAIGFSGHAYMPYSPYYAKRPDLTEDYKAEVRRLKEAYRDQIEIYLGLEVDMFAAPDLAGYDYLIGAVHYLKRQGEFIGFDRSAPVVAEVIDRHFGGDGMAYAREYYKTLAQLPEYGNFDILAHFDIITKHSENCSFFDPESKAYLHTAFEAVEALAGKIPLFEVNTGAIARGYRTTPYPSIPILRELGRRGFGAVITSDCHAKAQLDCRFDAAAELLRMCGFREKYILTETGFVPVPL